MVRASGLLEADPWSGLPCIRGAVRGCALQMVEELGGGFVALVACAAKTLEFSFTDGSAWHGPYILEFEVPAKFRNQPMSFFNEVCGRYNSSPWHEGGLGQESMTSGERLVLFVFEDAQKCAFCAWVRRLFLSWVAPGCCPGDVRL